MTRRTLFRLLHAAWAIPGLTATVFLISATKGHPPGIVFAPFALAIWGLGHLVLWGTDRLAGRGLVRHAGLPTTWPIPVVLALVGSGIVTFLGVLFIGSVLLQRHSWTLWNLLVLAVVAAHPPAFAGLLLRRNWARLYAALLAAFWALLMLFQVVETLWRGGRIGFWEWPLAAAIIFAFGWLSRALLASRAVRDYFATATEEPVRQPAAP